MGRRRFPDKSQITAVAVTLLLAVLIVVILFYSSLSYDERAALSAASVPEPEQEEDVYLDPPLIVGDEDVADASSDQPAAAPLGEPETAPVENDRLVVKGENPKPVKTQEKILTQKDNSALKSPEPSRTEKPESRVASQMSKNFGAKNGKPTGVHGEAGSGGKGAGVSGKIRGRKFLGCPMPVVALKSTVTVVIAIRVDSEGKVIEASVKSGGGASRENRDKCLASARKARWSAKAGAAPVSGTLTFTLVPKT